MKFFELMGDAIIVVGCVVGVGFLSGKEIQLFVGNYPNILLFCLIFFCVTFCVRELASKTQCGSLSKLSQKCFGKFASAFEVCMLSCSLVCLATTLAGLESCMQSILGILPLPLYSVIAVVLCAIVTKKGIRWLKNLNIVCLILCIVTVILLYFLSSPNNQTLDIAPSNTFTYALFSVTMALPILCKLSQNKTTQFNTASTIVATAIIALLTCLLFPLCDFDLHMPAISCDMPKPLLLLCCLTLLLCSLTSVISNATPLLQAFSEFITDKNFAQFLVYSLGVTFSLLGFDFALKYGYLFVAGVGILLVGKSLIVQYQNRKTKKSR